MPTYSEMIRVCGKATGKYIEKIDLDGHEVYYNYNPIENNAQDLELVKRFKIKLAFDSSSRYACSSNSNFIIRYSTPSQTELNRAILQCAYYIIEANEK